MRRFIPNGGTAGKEVRTGEGGVENKGHFIDKGMRGRKKSKCKQMDQGFQRELETTEKLEKSIEDTWNGLMVEWVEC